MISTASGFIAGLLTGIYVSSMYGEQLAASLREAVLRVSGTHPRSTTVFDSHADLLFLRRLG